MTPRCLADKWTVLLSEVEESLIARRVWHPAERERENARRRLLLSLDLHRLLYVEV